MRRAAFTVGILALLFLAGVGIGELIDRFLLNEPLPAPASDEQVHDEWRVEAERDFIRRACYNPDTGEVNPLCATTTRPPATTRPPTTTVDYSDDRTIECGLEVTFLQLDFDFIRSFLYEQLVATAATPDLFAVHYEMLTDKIPAYDARLKAFTDDCRDWINPGTASAFNGAWASFLDINWAAAQEACPSHAPAGFTC